MAALLDQLVHLASPVIPPPVMSLGPEPVTDHVRAEERAEEQARRQAEEPSAASAKKKAAPKTAAPKKAIPPELEERQESNSSHARAGCSSTAGKFSLLFLKHFMTSM